MKGETKRPGPCMRPEALIDWTAADLSGTLRSMGLAPVKVFGRPSFDGKLYD